MFFLYELIGFGWSEGDVVFVVFDFGWDVDFY